MSSVFLSYEAIKRVIGGSDRTGQEEWRVVDAADVQSDWITTRIGSHTLALGRDFLQVDVTNGVTTLVDIKWMPLRVSQLPRHGD